MGSRVYPGLRPGLLSAVPSGLKLVSRADPVLRSVVPVLLHTVEYDGLFFFGDGSEDGDWGRVAVYGKEEF